MRNWYRRGFSAAALLALAGCTEQATVNPTETLTQLRAGQPLLACHEPCLAAWRSAQPQAAQLDAGARWQDLAILLGRTGYQDDLSLYYLGRAAEGLGARGAAISYYRQSMHVSGTPNSCQSLSRQCGGVALPRAAGLRVAAIERELNRARPRRIEAAPQESTPPEAVPAEIETTTPAPIPKPAGPPATEYIEPPPAPR